MAEALSLKTLDIDWCDLEIAFRDSQSGVQSYLDLFTGEVLAIFDPGDPEAGLVQRHPDRFVAVPAYRTDEALAVLRNFVFKMEPGHMRDRLMQAQRLPGALARCEMIMQNSTHLLDVFAKYEERAVYERLVLWLGAIGVCALRSPPSGTPLLWQGSGLLTNQGREPSAM